MRLWDVYEGRGQTDVLPHQHDVLTVAFRPDGKQIAAATLDGQVFLWDPNDAKLEGTIEGRGVGGKVIGDEPGANAAQEELQARVQRGRRVASRGRGLEVRVRVRRRRQGAPEEVPPLQEQGA